LYVGKADRLRERVRSYFVANTDHARKVRQAIRLVERIDWDETCTPLEAVVREQELILEHRPPCNLHGSRPENYVYLKAGGSGLGLNLYSSSRAPRWLASPCAGAPSPRRPVVIGPFRGRARLNAALDLLHRCYPIRRCPRHPDGQPCLRAERGRCLAPCAGDPGVAAEHDNLVMAIVAWLAGCPDGDSLEPLERADEVMRSLSRQRRYEEAQAVEEAGEHLLSVRRAYRSLAEAGALRFASLWPEPGNGDGACVRLNLVWDGRLREPVSLHPRTLEKQVETVLEPLWHPVGSPSDPLLSPTLVAVPQSELDSLLAIRRWFHESGREPALVLPGPEAGSAQKRALKEQLVAEAYRILADEPPILEEAGPAL